MTETPTLLQPLPEAELARPRLASIRLINCRHSVYPDDAISSGVAPEVDVNLDPGTRRGQFTTFAVGFSVNIPREKPDKKKSKLAWELDVGLFVVVEHQVVARNEEIAEYMKTEGLTLCAMKLWGVAESIAAHAGINFNGSAITGVPTVEHEVSVHDYKPAPEDAEA
jgi:hypothetical protein